jgi:hypothetical protein
MGHRLLFLCLAGVIFFLSLAEFAKSQPQGQFEPPGKQEIRRYPLVLDSPPPPAKKTVDAVKLRAEANELAELAHGLPSEVDQISQGKLPRDLAEKLKRIEKLSKQLQSELAP